MKNKTGKIKSKKDCDHWFQFYKQGPIRKEALDFLKKNKNTLKEASYWGTIAIMASLLNTEDTYKCVYCRKEIKR